MARKKQKVVMTCAFKLGETINYRELGFEVVGVTENGNHYLVTIEKGNSFLIIPDYELLEYNMDLVIEQVIDGKKYYVTV